MKREIIKKTEELTSFLSSFNKKCYSLDTETTSLRLDVMKLDGISLCDGNNSCYIDVSGGETTLLSIFKNELCDSSNLVIMQNASFDIKVLAKFGVVYNNIELFDTMIADHLIDENNRHGLKEMAVRYLGVETEDYDSTLDVHSQKFYDYALNDAVWTFQIAQYQRGMMRQEGVVDLFRNIEMPFLKVLVAMETNGVLIDQERVVATTKELLEKKFDLEINLHESISEPYLLQHDLTGGMKVVSNLNFGSPKQLANILFDKLNFIPSEKTPNGAPSVGKKTLQDLKDKHPFIKLLVQYKICTKLLNGFFEPMPKFIQKDGRIRPSFHDTGTKTGRISCSTPNFQQLPKKNDAFPVDVRSCFIAQPGYKMIACDYSGQELRVLAHITQEPSMIENFNKGKDLHISTANDFFNLGIPEEGLYNGTKEHTEAKEKFKMERDKAKTINFGMAYGKGAYGFSKDFNITEKDAEEILKKYFAALPSVKQAIEDAHNNVRQHGYVTSLTGRRRRFSTNNEGYYPNGAFRQSFNFLIQGYSADMIRMAANKTYMLTSSYHYWDLRLLFTVHDEIVYEVKEEYAEEASIAIKEAFETVTKFSVPLEADVLIGNNYGEVK